jgi:hypothetical protein
MEVLSLLRICAVLAGTVTMKSFSKYADGVGAMVNVLENPMTDSVV